MQRPAIRLLTLSLLATACAHARAQSNSDNTTDEDIYELVTTAIHTRSAETALPVTVLTGDALHDAARATLGDTLSAQPGISNASFGPAVGQPVIRGQQGRRVMNLNNSIPNGDASGNSADHAQAVEPVLATSIEVLRGPSTLLYGGGAIGGVVNVIDRRIATSMLDQAEFAFETRYDTAADLHSTIGTIDFATGPLVWHLDGVRRSWNDLNIPGFAIDPAYMDADHAHDDESEHEEADADHQENTFGYIANSGGKTETATGGVSWIFDSGHFGMALSQLDNNYGLPPGSHNHGHAGHDHDDLEDEHEHEAEHGIGLVSVAMKRTRYDLDGEWRDLTPWLETVSYKASKIDYQHAEIENGVVAGTRFNNDSLQHRLQLTHSEFNNWHGVLGLQYSSEKFGAVGTESFIPVSDITSQGIYLVEDFHTSQLTYELGARFNHDDYDPQEMAVPGRDFSTTSFSGSALWSVSEPFTIGLSLARSERAPSIEELYSNFGLHELEDCVMHFATGACEVGNTEFREERSLNTDLTLAWEGSAISATLTLFNNRFKDYIAQVATGETVHDLPLRLYQQEDARFRGLEVDLEWRINELLSLRMFGDRINASLKRSGDVPRLPPSRVGVEAHLSGNQWSAYASWLHAYEQDKPGTFELPTNSWSRLEVGADYRIDVAGAGELLLFAKLRNAGDDTIRLSTSYLRGFAPEAGRSLETGIRFRY